VSQGDLWVTIGSNTGSKFLLYKNNILTSPGQIYFAIGDEVKIIPNNPGTANLEIISDEPGCNNWVEDNTATLPLPITYYTQPLATLQDIQTHITWSVSTQINHAKYIIEHSKDGKNFTPIGEIAGDGTSNETKHYEYIHTSPSIGINYYRIKQVDFDGQYSYSDIASVRYDGSGETKIFPNPAKSEVTITTSNQTTLQIIDVYGRVLSKQDISEGQNTINLGQLPRGILIFVVGDKRYKVLKE